MSGRAMTRTIDLVMRKWAPLVSEAALVFERRWTRRALRQYNRELADQFEAQLARFEAAMTTGTSTEVETEGARLCRAYGVIATRMQAAEVPDDAYMVGRHVVATGKTDFLTIAISATPAAGERARELHGEGVLWFSPDELATIVALDLRAKKVAAVKAMFPGAEIVGESAKPCGECHLKPGEKCDICGKGGD
jgi:hypothetical protein